MTDKNINRQNCSWVTVQAEELKALLGCDDKTIALNKTRAISCVETAIKALEEVKRYIETFEVV